MKQPSPVNTVFDNRLLECEELYRQRKPDIAHECLRKLVESDYSPEGNELGLFKFLLATYEFYHGNYQKSIELGMEANSLMADSTLHKRVGRIQLLLYRNYSSIGDLKRAEQHAYDALAFFRRVNDNIGMIGALNGLGKLSFIRSEFDRSAQFVNEAIELSRGDNVRMAELIGNLGRIEILNGSWTDSEQNLKTALKLADDLNQPISVVRNHLSLGFLYLRKRNFDRAAREFRAADKLADKRGDLLRDHIIYLEYSGELAFELGDMVEAKGLLKKGQKLARDLAPESSLMSQIIRRLSQVELALDNLDEALRLAQKALDLAEKMDEKTEIGLSRVVIAEIFAVRGNQRSALEYIQNGLDILRRAGDPYDVARSLLIQARIYSETDDISQARIDKIYDEAFRLFNRLGLHYWAGEVRYRQGIFACQHDKISLGFKYILESEKIFDKVGEKAKVRAVRLFKNELSKRAVDESISPENEFKIFGNYFSDIEYTNLKSGKLQEIIDILSKKTQSDNVIIYRIAQNDRSTYTSGSLTEQQQRRFIKHFEELLGEEIDSRRPTLILDSRRDPFINDLIQLNNGHVVSSVIVVPLSIGDNISGYVYLDRLCSNGDYSPFGQKELNFAVGFADLLSLKMAEYEKLMLEEDNKRLKAQLMEEAAFPNILTRNKAMLEMLSRVQQVVNSNISISIEGETGSGKDLLAKTIHYNSDRRDRRFISVNCAALPETLLESELFGHKKGAFTGADRDKVGLFEEAHGGTFFLDEIADMPLSIQAKVLRILEEKEIVRLGETKPVKVDVRIISATNKDLKEEMEAGRFRQDLYYRLSALCFKIPPLRDRKEDIPLLIDHFAEGKVQFTREAVRLLVAFDWPGNIRELENEIKKLTLLAGEKGIIDADLLSGKITDNVKDESAKVELNTAINFDDKFSLYDYLAEYEKKFIVKALREQRGVKKHAAASLNIPESTLRLKIKQYNIDLKEISAE